MIGLHCGNVDQWLVRALPELLVPYAHRLDTFGNAEHPGRYMVFEDVLGCYLEVLPASPARVFQERRACHSRARRP